MSTLMRTFPSCQRGHHQTCGGAHTIRDLDIYVVCICPCHPMPIKDCSCETWRCLEMYVAGQFCECPHHEVSQ